MPTSLILITPPAEEPVSLAQAKAYLRVDAADEDELIVELIAAARLYVEEFTRRALVSQEWDLVRDDAPAALETPRPPLAAVTGVYVTDDQGTETAVDPAVYWTDTAAEPGRLALRDGRVWPEHREWRSFRVRYTAGYGAAADVPAAFKQAILLTVSHWYTNRESLLLTHDAERLLRPYRVIY